MELQTKISMSDLNFQIDYHDPIALFGSCFSDHIGAKLEEHQFKTLSNPFGIIFHPIALAQLLKRVAAKDYFTEDTFFYFQERWHAFELHSKRSDPHLDTALKNANRSIDQTHIFLKTSPCVFITLGTAWGYVLKDKTTDNLDGFTEGKKEFWVANCHKQATSMFHKKLATPTAVETALSDIRNAITTLNPKAKIVFTVSPVRHLKDGIVANSRSKAHLLAGVHSYREQQSPSTSVSYFPVYEIFMDELRDYRFYKKDLIHPNDTAVDYIWELLVSNSFTAPTKQLLKEVMAIQKGLAHQAFNPSAAAHKKFEQQLKDRIGKIQQKHPHMFVAFD